MRLPSRFAICAKPSVSICSSELAFVPGDGGRTDLVIKDVCGKDRPFAMYRCMHKRTAATDAVEPVRVRLLLRCLLALVVVRLAEQLPMRVHDVLVACQTVGLSKRERDRTDLRRRRRPALSL